MTGCLLSSKIRASLESRNCSTDMSDTNHSSLKVSDFSFELPDELIARYPQEQRSASRLLSVKANENSIEHKHFKNIVD